MAKAAEHGLRSTPGTFQMKGIVSGVMKNQNFYSEKEFPNSKMRTVNLGVKYDTNKTLYSTIQGFTRADVYFSKRNKETQKTETKKVAWANRMTFAEQNPGWSVIGCTIGLEKGDDGKNIVKHLTEYDAAQYIKANIQDDMSVFVRGNLDFRSYTNDKGEVKRMTNYNATQVSLCAGVDFDAEDFEPTHDWTQELIYTGIEQETDAEGKATGRFIMSGYVVSYSAIEPVSFIVIDKKFATNVKKKIKPYTSFKCHGRIDIVHNIEEVEEETTNEWGETNKMNNSRANGSTIKEMVCTGLDGTTFNTDEFTEKGIAEGIKKLKAKEQVAKNYGDKKEEVAATNDDADDDWGDSASADESDEEIPW